MTVNKALAEGIYFNLSNEDYHNDSAISSSGIKLLLKNPYKFWWNSSMNPEKEKLDTKALRLGRLYHTLLLEPEKFKDEFLVLPKGKMIKSYLKERGLELEDVNHLTNIRESEVGLAKRAIETIKEDDYYNDWFKGGYPEVSIIWHEKDLGVNCRVRFDYLSPRNSIDYKTTADIDKLEKSITDYDYNLSAALYLRGLAQLKVKALCGEEVYIDGNDEQKKWFKEEFIKSEENFIFKFLFQEKTPPFMTDSVYLDDEKRILTPSRLTCNKAIEIYNENIKTYGTKKWRKPSKIRAITAADLPISFLYKMDEMLDQEAGV